MACLNHQKGKFSLYRALLVLVAVGAILVEGGNFQREPFLEIESSIIPFMEKWENAQNLYPSKYSSEQFEEILDALAHKDESIRAASFNILFDRYDHKLDRIHRWPSRFPRVLALLQSWQADIIGLQELDPAQAKDLLPELLCQYDFFVKDNTEGELNGILYKKDRFELVEGKVWYMTPTAQVISQETLTMVHLRDRYTGKEIAIFNVHLAFGKIEKRHFQAKFIAANIRPFAKKMAVLLMGDMNTFPQRLDLEKLPFYDGDYIERILTQKGALNQSRFEAVLGHIGPLSTYSNEDEESIPFTGTGTPGVFLDHILVSKKVKVLLHAVDSARVGGHYPSDHLPVVIDLIIKD